MNFSTTREHGSLESRDPTEKENKITGNIIEAAIDRHRILGPGLLESAYEACLIYELRLRKLKVESQKAILVFYKDVMLDCGYRADLVIEDQVIVELNLCPNPAPLGGGKARPKSMPKSLTEEESPDFQVQGFFKSNL
jgi:GxxExxY protein